MPLVRCPHIGCPEIFDSVYGDEGWERWYICPHCGGIVHVKIRDGSSKIKKIIAHNKMPSAAKIVVGRKLEEEVFF